MNKQPLSGLQKYQKQAHDALIGRNGILTRSLSLWVGVIGLMLILMWIAIMPPQLFAQGGSSSPYMTYQNNFESGAGPEWSQSAIDVTPSGDRSFLGQFNTITVSLTLSDLDEHDELTLEFDVYVIKTWDGAWGGGYSPDRLTVSVAGGPTLLNKAYNLRDWDTTGAVEVETLGYSAEGIDDAVFHYKYTFPHSASSVTINFEGKLTEPGGSNTGNESWGLDNVEVYNLPISPDDQTHNPNECPVCSDDTTNYTGGPINTRTGNYGYEATDFSIPTLGRPLRFERTYNSMTALTQTIIYSESLGYGWTHNYDLNLTLPDDRDGEGETVILKAPHGSRMRFHENDDGSYSPYPGITANLVRLGQTAPYSYVITATNQTRFTFGMLSANIALEPIVNSPGISLTLNPSYQVGLVPGSSLTLTHRLTNSTASSDTYDLTTSAAWITVEPLTATLESGEAIVITAHLTIPHSYGRDSTVKANIKATSQNTPTTYSMITETLNLRGYRLLTTHDPQGNVTYFDYDSQGYLGRVSGPTQQRWLDFDYDEKDRISRITDHTNRSVEYGYDNLSNLTVVTDTRDLQWRYVYTDDHLLHNVIDPDNRTVEKTYFDDQYRAYLQVDGLDRTVTQISYQADGVRVISETGHILIDTYNDQGILVSQSNALGQEQTFAFDQYLNQEYVEDANNNPTYYERSPFGLTTSVTDAKNNKTSYTYDDRNNLESSTDTEGRTTYYLYDSQNNLISTTNSLKHTNLYTYSAKGQTLASSDANGNTTRYGYNLFGNRTVITNALDNVTRTEYDNLGRVVTSTDALGKVTLNHYDAGDNLIKTTQNYTTNPAAPANEYNLTTHYGYDGAGRRTLITNTLNQVTENVYDAAGRLEKTIQNKHATNAEQNYQNEYNLITRYGYDDFGRQVSTTDTLGHINHTVYDDLGRVKQSITNWQDDGDGLVNEIFDPGQPDQNITIDYIYDANGNMEKIVELLGSGEERASCTVYDELNRVERSLTNCVTSDPANPNTYSSQPDEDLVSRYVYDDLGNQKEVIDPLGRKTSYDYDQLNRVITLTNPLEGETVYGYDPAGNRITTLDAEGRATQLQYDALNRVVTSTNALEGQNIVVYNAVGNRSHTIDAEQQVTTYTYDSLYRLLQTENAAGETQSQSYDALSRRLSSTDAANTVTRYQYDSLNRLITTTLNYQDGEPVDNQSNIQLSVSYDALSRRTKTLDARQNPINYGYDGLGRTIAITDALDNVTRYSYDGHGKRRFVTNAASEQSEFQYDGLGRLIKTIDPENNETSYSYDKGGNRLTMTDAETVTTRYGYDNLSRLILVTENYIESGPSDHQTNVSSHYGYDRVGNRTVITDARGYATHYLYDALNRRIEQTNAEGYTTRYGYDQLGNRTIMTDANTIAGQGGATTTFYYDRVNRLTDINYSDSISDVQISYDAVGNRKIMIDSSGQTDYDYDELYRLSDITDGANQHVGYRYDAAGNRTQLIYPNNQVVTYTYDAANRLDTVTDWQDGQFVYTYDDANRLDSLTMPHNLSSHYSYDQAGRLTQLSHTTSSNTIASYSYALDNVGNRSTLTESVVTNVDTPQGSYLEQDGLVVLEAERYGDYVSGTSHSWAFTSTLEGYHHPGYLHAIPDIDALYQTQTLTDSPTLDYLIHFTTPGTYTLWARAYADNGDADSLHLVLNQQPLRLSGFSPEAWSWSNQAMSQPTHPLTLTIESSGLHTLTVWMREDGLRLDRLLLTTDPTFIPTDLGPDPTVRQRTETIIHYDYDPLYRLTNADYSTGETYAYNYDPVGNRLQQIIDGDTTSYLYDDANRLQSVDGTPYTFDANGNLLNSDTMTNTWDAVNRLTKIVNPKSEIVNRYNGVNDRVGQTVGITTTYFALDVQGLPEVIYTSEGNAYLHLPGVTVAESSTGETRYLLSDGLGSIRQAVDESGAVVAYNEFDPYGNPVQNDSSPYGYTGEWWQDEVELLHLRARWYSPGTGTFLSVDAVESEPPYQYVGGNPVNWTDTSGFYPDRQAVEGGRAEFTCNCGWIDWNHIEKSASLGFELMDDLLYVNNNFNPDPSLTDNWGINVSLQLAKFRAEIDFFENIAVVPHSSVINGNIRSLAVSIFMDANEQFEEKQGANQWIPFGGTKLAQSFYSEEDLPSDIIGFYIGMQRYDSYQPGSSNDNLYQTLAKSVKNWCKAVNTGNSTQNSLKVFEEAYGNGTKFETGWRSWYPRLISGDELECDTCDEPRQWPTTFSMLTSQRIPPQFNGTWWWHNGTQEFLTPTEKSRVYRYRHPDDSLDSIGGP